MLFIGRRVKGGFSMTSIESARRMLVMAGKDLKALHLYLTLTRLTMKFSVSMPNRSLRNPSKPGSPPSARQDLLIRVQALYETVEGVLSPPF